MAAGGTASRRFVPSSLPKTSAISCRWRTIAATGRRARQSLALKRQLLRAVAAVARGIHDHGLNHRDFYICHLCLDSRRLEAGGIHLYLIDLHRMQVRSATPSSARMKDMAALYFSALDIGLTRRDCLRFLRLYRGIRLRETFRNESAFWDKVDKRACKLYHKFHGRWPITPFDRNA